MQENKLSFLEAVAMGVNVMVGAGILAAPSTISAAGGISAVFVWIFTTLIMLPVVYTSARLPEVLGGGGFLNYCKRGLGEFAGFLGGWIYLLSYLFAVSGILGGFQMFFVTRFSHISWLTPLPTFFAISLSILFLLNLLSEFVFAKVAGLLTIVKLIPVLVAIGFLPFFFKAVPLVTVSELPTILGTIPLSIFAFIGFEYLCNFSDKIQGGQSVARKAIMTAFVVVAVLYMLFHLSVLSIMGLDSLIQFKASGYAPFVSQVFPQIGAMLCLILPLTSFVTFMNGSNGLVMLVSNIFENLAKSDQIRFSNVLKYPISTGRSIFSVALTCLSVLFIAVAVGDTSKVMIGCGFVQMIILSIVMAILIKAEACKTNWFEKIISYKALAICLGLVVLAWVQIAPTNYERLMALMPFFIGVLFGLLLYKGSMSCQKSICSSTKNTCNKSNLCN